MTLLLAAALVTALRSPSPQTRERTLAPLVDREAARHGIPPRLFHRLISYESDFRYWAVSPRGAIGLGQLHQPLPAHLGTFSRGELEAPATNLRIAASMLSAALARCHGRIVGALRVYNRGHGCAPSAYASGVLLTDGGR